MSDEPNGLVQYEKMRAEVARCVKIDEAQSIKDKSAALAAYARQRNDKELEAWVAEIMCRACVRIGQLSKELEKGTPSKGHGHEVPASGKFKAAALVEAGLSTSSAQRYEEIAEPTKAERYYNDCKENGLAPSLGGLRNALKKDRRAEREVELGQATISASNKIGSRLYGVILADPPWRFAPYSRESGLNRAADNHYGTMSLDDIKALPVPAAPSCALFLWATAPMLPEALSVMQAWGFIYKSHCIWLKDRIGTGFWFRNKHEILLVGTRGDHVPAPAPGDQYESVISAAVGRHSSKPQQFAEVIEALFPNVPAIELFARGPRLGWDVWGNEAPPTTEVAA